MTKSSVFQVIDLDRTLFDTSKYAKAITDEVNLEKPGLGTKLDQRFEEAYLKEETFFLPRFLRHEYGDVWFEALVERVVRKYGGDYFLIDGTHERLTFADTLSDTAPAWGILTYGDEIDQYLKMRIIGLQDAPVFFTDTPDKAEVLRLWKTAEGKFQLPKVFGGKTVDIVILEDDKLRAFQNLPEGMYGLWIAAPGKQNHALHQDIPARVYPTQNLFDSIEKLRTLFEK